MSMIQNQIENLRYVAKTFENMPIRNLLNQAADTIELLSAKLQAANMERSTAYYNNGWISCNERTPEEKINPITKDFYEYQVTFQIENLKDVRHYKFGEGHWWNGMEIMDEYVTAWRMPLLPFAE